MSDSRQAAFWSRRQLARRRAPTHPVVAAYVRGKIRCLSRHVSLSPDTTLLDVGCGNGYFSHHFGAICRVTGVDFSATMLKMNRLPRKLQMDAGRLGFADRSFDIVFCHALLHHVPDAGQAIREMARVARRHVIILEPNRNNPLMFLFSALVPAERQALRFSLRYLCRLAAANGVAVEAAFSQGLIAQNRLPRALLPLFVHLDGVQPLGVTNLLIGRPQE